MNNILTEKEYQAFFLERLADSGCIIRDANRFDRYFALDCEMLFTFLNGTQPDERTALRKVCKHEPEDTLVNYIINEITKSRSSLRDVLKHGIEVGGKRLDLMYTKPATTFNTALYARYSQNVLSVMEEVWASDKERVDGVIFLNGFAVMPFELKCNYAHQNYEHAIRQYRTERNPDTRGIRSERQMSNWFWFK